MAAEERDQARGEPMLTLAEEVASFGKRAVVTGRVRVTTRAEEVEAVARGDLTGTTVEVTRVPVNRQVEEPPRTRTEGDLTVIPVVEERLVVEKRLFLVEELHVRRVTSTRTVESPVVVRREVATVERFDADGRPVPPGAA